MAHQNIIINQTEKKIGFFHLDQKSDNTMIVTLSKTREEWEAQFKEHEKLIEDFIDKMKEILDLIKKGRQ